jgi:hypothetical protein
MGTERTLLLGADALMFFFTATRKRATVLDFLRVSQEASKSFNLLERIWNVRKPSGSPQR